LAFHFEDFVLDPERRELRRADALIEVEPQVFDLIHYLVRERERVVTKDDVLDAVWSGRVVSESTLTSRINAARRALNDSGEEQRLIRTVPRKGFRFVGDVRGAAPATAAPAPRQEITFCRTSDGVSIAIGTAGNGLPLVKVGTWLTHAEHDWRTPVWGPFYARLARQFRLIHYDPRGCGLSDLDPAEISLEGFVRDLTAVVDACRLDRFALLCFSQGAAVGITYAARHPERVASLAIAGGFPLGWRKRGSEAEIATREALITLIRHGWGQDNPAFRQVFNMRLWPDLTTEQSKAFDELQRMSATPESAARIQNATGDIDVVDLLPKISAPTLVMHSRSDGANPRELGLMLARGIPGARFVELDSRNHVPMSHEAVWQPFIEEVCAFTANPGPTSAAG
jgi:DNA-binding winged helix-turn-helix (wHTH) protein/pimeloyl-ACP methyl ester carboxylesterase